MKAFLYQSAFVAVGIVLMLGSPRIITYAQKMELRPQTAQPGPQTQPTIVLVQEGRPVTSLEVAQIEIWELQKHVKALNEQTKNLQDQLNAVRSNLASVQNLQQALENAYAHHAHTFKGQTPGFPCGVVEPVRLTLGTGEQVTAPQLVMGPCAAHPEYHGTWPATNYTETTNTPVPATPQ